jgi:hypothetical protein
MSSVLQILFEYIPIPLGFAVGYLALDRFRFRDRLKSKLIDARVKIDIGYRTVFSGLSQFRFVERMWVLQSILENSNEKQKFSEKSGSISEWWLRVIILRELDRVLCIVLAIVSSCIAIFAVFEGLFYMPDHKPIDPIGFWHRVWILIGLILLTSIPPILAFAARRAFENLGKEFDRAEQEIGTLTESGEISVIRKIVGGFASGQPPILPKNEG